MTATREFKWLLQVPVQSLEVNSSPAPSSPSPTAAVRQHLHMLPRGYQFLIVNLAVKMTFVVLINQIQGGWAKGEGSVRGVAATRC